VSSELIEDVEDKHGISVTIEMKASGYAFLTLMSNDERDDEILSFRLTPDNAGLENARKIEDGLRAWREQVANLKNIGE
jgi:hypothetical protein